MSKRNHWRALARQRRRRDKIRDFKEAIYAFSKPSVILEIVSELIEFEVITLDEAKWLLDFKDMYK